MTNAIEEIIVHLERQKTAIERAIEALRNVGGTGASVPDAAPDASNATAVKRKYNRRSEGQKKRWALKKAAETAPVVSPAKLVRKGGMTVQGRKRLADAMKRRWAAKRAGSATKSVAKKSAGKKVA